MWQEFWLLKCFSVLMIDLQMGEEMNCNVISILDKLAELLTIWFVVGLPVI